MSVRFYDVVADNGTSMEQAPDFIVRKRIPTWQLIIIVFAVAAIVSILIGIFANSTLFFAEMIFILLCAIGVYVVLLLQRSRDLVLATEFQNAILSSGLAHSNMFCLIIKNDGSIAYIDKSLQEFFPNFMKESRRSIDTLLEQAQVSKEQRKIVFSAIEKRGKENIIFDILDSKKQVHRLIMSVEPLSKPQGFTILRGREFVKKRSTSDIVPSSINSNPVFSRANFDLFSYITKNMNIGSYITDGAGNIIYANPTLEKWLYYNDDEIVTGNLKVRNLVSQAGDGAFVSELRNFEGEVSMQRKVGGTLKVFINQKYIRNEQDVILGYVALIHPLEQVEITQKNSDKKDNSW